EDYLSHVVSIYRNEGIPESAIFEVFSGMRTSALLSSSRDHSSPDCMVFGSSAVVTNIECPAFPPPDETSRCGSISRFPAGPTIETATTLAELGLKVSFVSSIGNDQDGRDVISSLIKSNVDVSDLFIEDGKSTNQTVIINETKTSRTMIGVDSRTALSITTPMRVPWEKLETARLVYIGEVFIEVASTIAGYARGKGIPIVYRCSIPFLEEGLDTLIPVISQVDFILLSNDAWKYLQEKVGRNPTIKLRELTDASIIARTSSNSYKVFMKNQKPLTFRSQNHHGDMTRLFSAGFIDALVHGETSERAIKRGVNNEDERRMAS
ncbi:MAG: carbohydrate kinase family protein, partial [Candidatus Thorarchaeota archaeon]